MQTVKIQPNVTFDPSLSPGSAAATANANIALIKYWGKRDEKLILPYTSSLSLTLSDLYTKTVVSFSDDFSEDSVTLDGESLLHNSAAFCRVIATLDLVREKAGISTKARVVSHNHVPTAAGLASSASGFAALCAAASCAAGLTLTPRELSRLARRGSGSACRSIFGGLVVWHAGVDDETSYAEPLESADSDLVNLNFSSSLAMLVCVVDGSQKPISSREAMRKTVETSPVYMHWVEQSKEDFAQALEAIRCRDLEKLGEVVERNALGMHETMRWATPSVNYLTDKTRVVLEAVKNMRDCGWPVWATMDAGPNVKVLTAADVADGAIEELRARVESGLGELVEQGISGCADSGFEKPKFSVARPGSGVNISIGLQVGGEL